ncbi:putative membrane protein [Methylobacter tundripaludum]|uniref:Putative membrane protein n=1 Tax=Methylobacter tundripaludum TaxID=173365 RepID=A0A2S6HAQ1_9GAMM|nr:bestrophin family ion channel [Methylobacter tundripaludum]PPK74574.1 putative membrane protein [Methylobacter tundripaludum]
MKNSLQLYSNKDESPGFLRGALMWRGSVTPRIFPSLLLMTCYCLLIVALDQYWRPLQHLAVTPFEYTGVVLGLVLVFRTNAGHERWWEARKLWGAIVNQSRNIVIEALSYGDILNIGSQESLWRKEMVKWTVAFSFATRESLRNGKNFDDLTDLLSEQELDALKSAVHMPLFVASKIAELLQQARLRHHIDGFVFMEMEGQRILLIDHIGACERILKTPMPLVYAIKVRRFILIFLLLLPFSLIENLGFSAVFIFFLVAYPLLSLDRIGIELQSPFDTKNLSHLPLHTICGTIKLHCQALLEQSQQQ